MREVGRVRERWMDGNLRYLLIKHRHLTGKKVPCIRCKAEYKATTEVFVRGHSAIPK